MLERNRFVVREQVKFLTDRNTYAILDAETGEDVGTAEERALKEAATNEPGTDGIDLVASVSTTRPYTAGDGPLRRLREAA